MSWFNRSKKNQPAMSKLSKKVFEMSVSCTETLAPDLEKKLGKESTLFTSKYLRVLFGFMYFFIHLTDRYAFDQIGQEGRNQLIDELVPTTADTMIATLFGHAPKNTKDWIENDFYSKLNDAQMDYGRCKELFLKQEDDTRTLQKLASGAKSKSMVGQLTDNLSQIIEGEINTNALFTITIWEIVTQSLKKKELQDLVSKVSKEIK